MRIGIIPAAGTGSRIRALAFSKELLPVGSRLQVKAGAAYVDVGTFNGYRRAIHVLETKVDTDDVQPSLEAIP